MAVELRLAVTQYYCESCTSKQGTTVRELVRMMPRAMLFNGELAGEEWWGCPICLEHKFPVKKRKERRKDVAEPLREAGSSDQPAKGRRAKQAKS